MFRRDKSDNQTEVEAVDLKDPNSAPAKKKKENSNYEQFLENVPKSPEWFVVPKSNVKPSLYSELAHIDVSELEFGQIIGNGSFGQVWRGSWRSSEVAIKQVKPCLYLNITIIDFRSTESA